jgi:colicin import membrane protein
MADPVRKQPAGGVLDDDPFFYGSRWISVRLPDGRLVDQQIPLTPDDLLDPQLGDQVTQSNRHSKMARRLVNLLEEHFDSRQDVHIVNDVKMLWGIPKLSEPSPDIAVIQGVWSDDEDWDSFDVQREGARPCLILEVVSSKDAATRRNDYEKKVEIYERAGVPEYLIYDPPTPVTRGRLLLTGHRLGADGRYRSIEPDDRGFLLSETTGLLFGIARDGRTPLVVDAATGKRLLTGKERARKEAHARKAAEERARAAEERARNEAEARKAAEAELARLRAELERLKNS